MANIYRDVFSCTRARRKWQLAKWSREKINAISLACQVAVSASDPHRSQTRRTLRCILAVISSLMLDIRIFNSPILSAHAAASSASIAGKRLISAVWMVILANNWCASFRETDAPEEAFPETVASQILHASAKFCGRAAESPREASATRFLRFWKIKEGIYPFDRHSVSNRFARSWKSGFLGRGYLRIPFNRVLRASRVQRSGLGATAIARAYAVTEPTMIHRAGGFPGRGRNFLPYGLTNISALSRARRGRRPRVATREPMTLADDQPTKWPEKNVVRAINQRASHS